MKDLNQLQGCHHYAYSQNTAMDCQQQMLLLNETQTSSLIISFSTDREVKAAHKFRRNQPDICRLLLTSASYLPGRDGL